MLDMRLIRENPDLIRKALKDRNQDIDIGPLIELDREWRELIDTGNRLKHERNSVAQEIARIKEKDEKAKKIARSKEISDEITRSDTRMKVVQAQMDLLRLNIPNIPQPDVPSGTDSTQNVVVREAGGKPELGFKGKLHGELAESLDIVDFERGVKITGSGFYVLKGAGARIERALMNFMLDVHAKQGYTEVFTPFLVNADSMTGTGQLPKFAEDMYGLGLDGLFLIPTAEVPVTNLHRDEIFDGRQLPVYYNAYSACFRREAGKHTSEKGLIRVHQFNKVELVKFVLPDKSREELEMLTANAEEILHLLKIPYRVILLCTGDMGFSSSKTYDIEAWLPVQKEYMEISSCSNFTDFQARRANIKFRPMPHLPTEYVHTLNGSGLAIGRTMVAIIENYQQPDGSLLIPDVLRPYLGGMEKVEALQKKTEKSLRQ